MYTAADHPEIGIMSSTAVNILPTRTITSPGLVMSLAFTSGFIIMSVELLGGRILAPYFGSSIYVWGSIISIFMVALSTGYLIGQNSECRLIWNSFP